MIVVQTPFLSAKIKIGGYQKSALPPKSHFLDNTGLQKAYQHSYSVQTSLCPPTMVDLVLIFKEWAKFPIQAVFSLSIKRLPSMDVAFQVWYGLLACQIIWWS